MICPLMSKTELRQSNEYSGRAFSSDEFIPVECREAECAWFDCGQGRCFIPVIAVNLEALRSTIEIVGQGGS